ncbi:Condensation domain-containing protein [Sulfidibacter corallicola]|uniref:Condensation domain-containing protein n=1 Tax=Sulfidibacter corallicola TaxID=2818388 RepID=A0A8A4TPD8_SULCO|nr:condensation domain-containing protein [Sulfidibacter corallicola]QTD51836.1 hypothetical protein J3U87_05140 [Sulfidibacter corallicola]
MSANLPVYAEPKNTSIDLVPNQRFFWTDLVEKSEMPAVNIGSLIKIPAAVELPLFFQAYRISLAAHDALSMVMVRGGDGATVRQKQRHVVPVIEIRDCSRAVDPYDWAVQDATHLADGPLNPFAGPLYRSKLYILGPNCTAWTFVCHHMVCDGWSMALFVNDVMRTYRGLLDGEAAKPERPSFVAWARQGEFTERKDGSLYWRNRLPKKRESLFDALPGKGTSKRREFCFEWSEAMIERMASFGRENKNHPVRVVQALLGTALSHYFGKRDWVMGLPSSNRVNRKQKNMSGQFASCRPFPWRYEPGLSLHELLKEMGRDLRGDYRAGACVLSDLAEECHNGKTGNRPLFDVSFNALMVPNFDYLFDGEKATIKYLPFQHFTHPLEVACLEIDNGRGRSLVFNYDPEVLSEGDIRDINDILIELLERALEGPGRPLTEQAEDLPSKRMEEGIPAGFQRAN